MSQAGHDLGLGVTTCPMALFWRARRDFERMPPTFEIEGVRELVKVVRAA